MSRIKFSMSVRRTADKGDRAIIYLPFEHVRTLRDGLTGDALTAFDAAIGRALDAAAEQGDNFDDPRVSTKPARKTAPAPAPVKRNTVKVAPVKRDQRTPAQVEADKAKMARVRAARGTKTAPAAPQAQGITLDDVRALMADMLANAQAQAPKPATRGRNRVTATAAAKSAKTEKFEPKYAPKHAKNDGWKEIGGGQRVRLG